MYGNNTAQHLGTIIIVVWFLNLRVHSIEADDKRHINWYRNQTLLKPASTSDDATSDDFLRHLGIGAYSVAYSILFNQYKKSLVPYVQNVPDIGSGYGVSDSSFQFGFTEHASLACCAFAMLWRLSPSAFEIDQMQIQAFIIHFRHTHGCSVVLYCALTQLDTKDFPRGDWDLV